MACVTMTTTGVIYYLFQFLVQYDTDHQAI